MRPLARRGVGAVLVLGSLLTSATALAKPSKESSACYADFERSQELRRAHRLIEARASLSHCAVPTCPIAVSRPCEKWLAEVEAAIPTVTVRAETAAGEPIKQGSLSIDGAVRGELPMVTFSLDPGEHTFVLRQSGETVARATIVLAEGDKSREVLLRGPRPGGEPTPSGPPSTTGPATPNDRPRRGLSAGPIALFATSAVGLGLFAIVGAGARSDANDLRTRCSPRCPSSDVDGIRTRAIVADVGLGVGVVALAGGLYLALSRPASSVTASRTRRWVDSALSGVVAQPTMLGVSTTHSF